jgi:hypothetical protein
MCIKIDRKPTVGTEEIIISGSMHLKLSALLTWDRIKLDDRIYYAPGWDGWKKIIDYLCPKLPNRYTDKFDCDNCADWFKVRVAEDFGMNTCARVDGYADCRGKGMERHAWCLFFDSDSQLFFQLETMNGVIMDYDDPLYVPDEITMG